MVIFGGTLPATRIAVSAIDPMALTSLRSVIAGLCSLALLIVLRRPLPPRALWPQLLVTNAVRRRAVSVPDGARRANRRRLAWRPGVRDQCDRDRFWSPSPSPMSGRGPCSGSHPSPAPRS